MRSLVSIIFFIFCVAGALAQERTYEGLPSLIWPKLIDISYDEAEDEFGTYQIPSFSDQVKKIAGTEIYLPGYMIPFEGTYQGDRFILSALPLNACFFCGVGGPETVIEVRLRVPAKYTDKPVEFRGTLRLNDSDPDGMIYILEEASFEGILDF